MDGRMLLGAVELLDDHETDKILNISNVFSLTSDILKMSLDLN